jgi:hypothetical protein
MKTWSSIRQAVTATVLLVLASAAITSLTSIPAYANACPLTQGFWKNHPAAWPAFCLSGGSCLTLGCQSYTEAELLTILKTPVGGDASLNLAHQEIAAKLNILTGSVFPGGPPAVSAAIADADNLLCGFTGKLPYNVSTSSATGQQMVADAAVLDLFNSGALTPVCTPR